MTEEKRSFKSKARSFLLKVLAVVILLFIIMLWIFSWTYSEGTRSGQLIKFSEKGVVFKTHEGELNLGGLRTGNANDGLEGNLWQFSVLDENIVKELEKAEGKRVKLGYKQRYKAMSWQGDTDYFIVKVEVIEE